VYGNLPPSLARFSPEEPDVIIYTGYGMQKCAQFYSLSQRKVGYVYLKYFKDFMKHFTIKKRESQISYGQL